MKAASGALKSQLGTVNVDDLYDMNDEFQVERSFFFFFLFLLLCLLGNA